MLPLADVFLHAYVWVDDELAGGALPLPRRPGPPPACSDAELLAVATDLGSRLVRAWGIVPAAVDERAVADGLLEGVDLAGLLLDRGFVGRAWAAQYRQRGVRVVLAPGRAERRAIPGALRRPVA